MSGVWQGQGSWYTPSLRLWAPDSPGLESDPDTCSYVTLAECFPSLDLFLPL